MKLLRLLLLPALLLGAAGCKKDSENSPSKSAQLTAVTWKESSTSLVINGVEGKQNIAPADADTYKFTSDGKVAVTSGTTTTTGSWALANNDSQLVITPSSGPAQTYELFAVDGSNLSYGYSFSQAQVQSAVNGQTPAGVPPGLISLLILSAGNFTFPPNTNIPANQITSMQYRINLVKQ